MLPSDWWIRWREDEPVHAALVQSHCCFWTCVVDETLQQRETTQQMPCTWQEVAVRIYRVLKNVERWKTGKQSKYAPHAFLALSSVLKLEASDLIPNNLRWLSCAVRILCDQRISVDQSRVFAACCLLTVGPQELQVDKDSLQRIIDRSGTNLSKDDVLNTCLHLKQILTDRLRPLTE